MEETETHGPGPRLTRRGLLARGSMAALGTLVATALPVARAWEAERAEAQLGGLPTADPDGTLQAFADTMVPGRQVARTESGAAVAAGAIAGVDPLPGAVEADALALYHHPEVGFDALSGPFLAELQERSLAHGGDFLSLAHADREAVALAGLDFSNPTRLVWEAAAAVPFTAFCAAALVADQTAARAAGYRVMGHPGRAPAGYADFSYRRVLARESTRTGSLP